MLLIAASIIIPGLTHWRVHVIAFAPLHATWSPRVGPGTVPAILIALGAIIWGPRAAATLPWHRLLAGAFVVGVAWLTALATVDGWAGIGHILDTSYEYLRTAREVAGRPFAETLDGYIPRITHDPGKWPVHIAGHPPGALLFFVVLVRLGLGSGLAAGWVVLVLAATTPVAVLITLRRLAAEGAARRAAPFLVLGPAAIWSAVSADAMFGTVGAWGLCCLAVAATTRGRWRLAAWAFLAGLLLGYCVMLSYGLPLLGIAAVAVLLLAGNWRPLLWAVGGALAVVLGFAFWGFAWWEAYPVLRQRYYNGVAHKRPFSYWVWGNLGAFAISAGPLVGAGIGSAIAVLAGSVRRATGSARRLHAVLEARVAPATILALAGFAMVLAADLSGMSKAEVERIWLPFAPWALIGTALLPRGWRRPALAGQLAFALVVQHVLATGW